jgi:hypothetical protein
MKTVSAIFFCFYMLFVNSNSIPAKEWRGIVPLLSTREDVERLLGPPTKPGGHIYGLEGEQVAILYTDSGCNVPPDTVHTITVNLKTEQVLSQSGFDLTTFKVHKLKMSDPPGIIFYVNDEQGIVIVSREGQDIISAITYNPTAKERQWLRCSKQ